MRAAQPRSVTNSCGASLPSSDPRPAICTAWHAGPRRVKRDPRVAARSCDSLCMRRCRGALSFALLLLLGGCGKSTATSGDAGMDTATADQAVDRTGTTADAGSLLSHPVTRFQLADPVNTPNRIVSGSDGALWFTYGGSIGRITVTGQVTQYPLTTLRGPLADIA